jgi:hypothetical protein
MDALDRCADENGDCGKKPEFGEAIFIDEHADRVRVANSIAWWLLSGRCRA